MEIIPHPSNPLDVTTRGGAATLISWASCRHSSSHQKSPRREPASQPEQSTVSELRKWRWVCLDAIHFQGERRRAALKTLNALHVAGVDHSIGEGDRAWGELASADRLLQSAVAAYFILNFAGAAQSREFLSSPELRQKLIEDTLERGGVVDDHGCLTDLVF
ncbi:MAG TPA: hypothetical protein VK466_16290 [Terriglobales bacterium]|nr:hypothetical protein [Terriglobales bacterium]